MAKISVLNADILLNKLSEISSINLESALTKAALIVENDAKINCPVGDTGLLRSSITHEVEKNQAVIGTNIEYGPYVEVGTGIWAGTDGAYGKQFRGTGRQDRWCYQDAKGDWHSTIGQKPQPFLEPALVTNKKEINNIVKEEAKKELEKIARR